MGIKRRRNGDFDWKPPRFEFKPPKFSMPRGPELPRGGGLFGWPKRSAASEKVIRHEYDHYFHDDGTSQDPSTQFVVTQSQEDYDLWQAENRRKEAAKARLAINGIWWVVCSFFLQPVMRPFVNVVFRGVEQATSEVLVLLLPFIVFLIEEYTPSWSMVKKYARYLVVILYGIIIVHLTRGLIVVVPVWINGGNTGFDFPGLSVAFLLSAWLFYSKLKTLSVGQHNSGLP